MDNMWPKTRIIIFLLLENVISNASYVNKLQILVHLVNMATSETLLLLVFVNQAIMIQMDKPKIALNALLVAISGNNIYLNINIIPFSFFI